MNPVDVVLVRPIYGRNVGYVSRAMANMGGGRLILIGPQCEIDHEAHQGAAGAQQRLIEATIYPDWATFLAKEPEGVRFAFCRRTKKSMDHMPFTERLRHLIKSKDPLFLSKCYFVFGPEDDGLTTEDLESANFIVTLPVYGEFKSLNLAHAVLLALALYGQVREQDSAASAPAASEFTPQNFYFPEQAIKNWLTALGFNLERHNDNAYATLKKLLLKNLATAKEMRIFEAVVNQTVRKLRKES